MVSTAGEIWFYAPMKSPNHAVPSGDREIARLLLSTLEQMDRPVVLASELSSFDKTGDEDFQNKCLQSAHVEVERLVADAKHADEGLTPSLWLTYHNYYKAPDLLGPAVSKALDIPYIVIEGTRAKKRLTGPWSRFAEAAEAGLDHAAHIFSFTEDDERALIKHKPAYQELHRLAPFIDLKPLKPPEDGHEVPLKILTVAMMRDGAKMASYRLLAETMADLQDEPVHWTIVGDGPCRAEVETLLTNAMNAVTFTGAIHEKPALNDVYRDHHVFIWPGVDEAVGMVYLEAQAHGLPTLAYDYPGPCATLTNPDFIIKRDDRAAMAESIRRLVHDQTGYEAASEQTRRFMVERHSMEAAMNTLSAVLP